MLRNQRCNSTDIIFCVIPFFRWAYELRHILGKATDPTINKLRSNINRDSLRFME